MRQWFALKCIVAAGVLGVLAACAQSPQILSVNPKVSGGFPQTGNGQAVTLEVVDGRSDSVIGTRSGTASSTSTITVEANDVIPKLQAQAEGALRSMGFNPTRQASGGPTLTLTLSQLDYARANADQPMLDATQLQAVIEAKVDNGGDTYSGRYTSKRKQSYAFKPDWDTNNRMVSDLLGDALDRTFRDPQLGNLLAR
ncbi:YajG family lipoprotein [Salinicola avicenniae]|uniref:YajG family lipoprotein n=1 Tax=Salinicola avicenniae TaxID=2916836 RepID=UPI0020742AAA|nr:MULTISPECIES: YajG family lipoprotein [unclassified Salinicola]